MSDSTRPEGERIRVAVLGGGVGAMTAVWGLMQSDDADHYDVTVYQMGWRLGGKGASGRNREYGDRIEEHGLHVWGGMYENAFHMMRQVYGELDRPPEAPLSRWYDAEHPERSAFLPHSYITMAEFEDGRWQPWNLAVPINSDLPGSGTRILPRPGSILEQIVEAMIEAIAGADFLSRLERLERGLLPRWLAHALDNAAERIFPPWACRAANKTIHSLLGGLQRDSLEVALGLLRELPGNPVAHEVEHINDVLDALISFKRGFMRSFGGLLRLIEQG